MNWNSQQIADRIGAKHPPIPAQEVGRILFDSRQFSAGEGQLFFALRGKHHDGHHYIESLYQKGVRLFVVEEIPGLPVLDEALFLVCPNSLEALQSLARSIREEVNPKLIAITGSNGKTVVKEWLYRLMNSLPNVYRSPKSFNSQIGVPLALWAMPENCELGIFEAGISLPGEMAQLEAILKPEGGIFTNIGSAHGENFRDNKQKIQEKLKLFKDAKFLIYPADQAELVEEIERYKSEHNLKTYPWSIAKGKAEAWLEILDQGSDHCHFRFHNPIFDLEARIPFGDEASIQNAVNALYMALHLGVEPKTLQRSLQALSPIEMRLEMKEGHQNTLLINDAYNSDLESLRIALHFLQEHGKDRSKVLVLSDMMQSGLSAEALQEALSQVIANQDLGQIFAIGPQLQTHPLNIQIPVEYFESTEAFRTQMFQYSWQGRAVLLKGSRPFAFEKIDKILARQRHETVMEIHLNRLVHNLNYYRSRLQKGTKLMVMVKAFAYGTGSEEVARVLAFHGVDYLAVAYADEGVALRKAGIALPIMVLNPETSALDSFFDYQLEPEVYSFKRLEEIVQLARLRDEGLKIHLKLETGMNRLGFSANELEQVILELKACPELELASVFSHLAASDDPTEAEFTQAQIARFKSMTALLEKELGAGFLKHIANTGAIEAYPEAYFDMVRLGIGLYGVAPHPEEQAQLLAVAELKATVSQVKELEAGDSVGYGRSWKAEAKERIAVVSIGYADGYARSLSNGKGQVAIRGKRYPIVGRVCMDMCMVAVGDDPIKEGDEVLIFGQDLPVQEMATAMNTIAYEVLTGISARVKRVYYMA